MIEAIDLEKCTGCGICDDVCPADVIHMEPVAIADAVIVPSPAIGALAASRYGIAAGRIRIGPPPLPPPAPIHRTPAAHRQRCRDRTTRAAVGSRPVRTPVPVYAMQIFGELP